METCDRLPPDVLAHVVGNQLVMYPDASTAPHQIDVTVYRDQKGNPTTLHLAKTVDNQEFHYQDFSLIDPLEALRED